MATRVDAVGTSALTGIKKKDISQGVLPSRLNDLVALAQVRAQSPVDVLPIFPAPL